MQVSPEAVRLAERFTVRLAAQQAHQQLFPGGVRSAHHSEITPAVLEAFGSFVFPFQGRVAFGSLTRKLKQLGQVFAKSKGLWEAFKSKLGVRSLLDLPKAIKDLAKQGYAALRKAVSKMFDSLPLKLFTLEESKLMSVNAMLGKLMEKYPKFGKWLGTNVRPRVDQFDLWLRKNAPVVSGVLMLAVYIWIWLNVVEFEWDMQSLTDAITGRLSLSELLTSLPGSAIGFLLNAFNLGTFTLLPAALAARLLFLLSKRYVVWDGGLRLDTDRIRADFS